VNCQRSACWQRLTKAVQARAMEERRSWHESAQVLLNVKVEGLEDVFEGFGGAATLHHDVSGRPSTPE
jgi:hypothetical protein